MSRNPALVGLQSQIDTATSIADVLRVAHSAKRTIIVAQPCGYLILEHDVRHVRDVQFTADDRAWFRAPIKGGH